MILHFHLYRGEDERKSMADCLAKIIHENGDRINTGFVGTPYILHALSETDIQTSHIRSCFRRRCLHGFIP